MKLLDDNAGSEIAKNVQSAQPYILARGMISPPEAEKLFAMYVICGTSATLIAHLYFKLFR